MGWNRIIEATEKQLRYFSVKWREFFRLYFGNQFNWHISFTGTAIVGTFIECHNPTVTKLIKANKMILTLELLPFLFYHHN